MWKNPISDNHTKNQTNFSFSIGIFDYKQNFQLDYQS